MESINSSTITGFALFSLAKAGSMYAAQENPTVALSIVNKLPGALLNGRDKKGRSIIHYAAQNGYLTLAKALVKKKVNLNTTDNEGQTPRDLAQKNGHQDLAYFLQSAS